MTHLLDSDCAAAVRTRIGKLMGDSPAVVWQIMNRDETASCMTFSRENSRHPEQDARAWLEEQDRQHPVYFKQRGYHVVRCEVWPDYLGQTADAMRFVSWALKHSRLADAGVGIDVPTRKVIVYTRECNEAPVGRGSTIQLALAQALLALDEVPAMA